MDNEIELLEAELKSLRPVAPGRALVARVERDLSAVGAPRRASRLFWFWAGALPAAASLAVGLAALMQRDLNGGRGPAGAESAVHADSSAVLKPVAVENVLYSAQDEGLVTLDDGTRARRERLNFVDTITWRNPRTNASLQWSVPREEIRVVPVSFQ